MLRSNSVYKFDISLNASALYFIQYSDMFWPRLDNPQVQTTDLKHTVVKCTSSCIIFKIGSNIFSNVPFVFVKQLMICA